MCGGADKKTTLLKPEGLQEHKTGKVSGPQSY